MSHIINLVATQVHEGITPWDWTPTTPFPEEIRTDKKARDAWATNPKTESNFYTGYEGLLNVRIRNGGAEDGNPPIKEHFLVADFDSPVDEAMAIAAANKFDPKPNRLEKTLSGNWRAIWFLEVPIVIPSYEWARHFKKNFAAFAFSPIKLLPGFDKGAWEAPERFWTNSGQWFAIHDEKIPASRIQGWQFLASQKFDWKKAFNAVEIPPDVAAAELAKKYPRFSEWPGEFELESQGPTFWIDQSTSPKSAIVRETGIQTFSDHAGRGFYTWADLLGVPFTKAYEADAVGRAVQGIYFDGKNYWRETQNNRWEPFDTGDLSRHLRVTRRVSAVSDKDRISDIDRALEFVQNNRGVIGAVPLICRRPGLATVNGDAYLNTHNKTFLTPAPGEQIWGTQGNFPWISEFLEKFFDRGEADQLQFFISWLAHFYQSGISYTPTPGLIAIIAGPPGIGKTFLVRRIIGEGLVGGIGEAAEYLQGKDNFGAELFSAALWAIDDGTSATDAAGHKRFSEILKRSVANDTHRFHAKYRQPCVISWMGRICISLNEDAESLRMIPDMDISIREKISLFRCSEKPIEFPDRSKTNAILNRELPFFAAYLRDFNTPERCVGTSRFGIKPWHDSDLLESANQASPTSAFEEILDAWRTEYFKKSEETDYGTFKTRSGKTEPEYWEGTSAELHMALNNDLNVAPAIRAYTVDRIGREVSRLIGKGQKWISRRRGHEGRRLIQITRPEQITSETNQQMVPTGASN